MIPGVPSTSLLAAVCGLGLGCGLFCLWWACWPAEEKRAPKPFLPSLADAAVAAGFPKLSPAGLLAISAGVGMLVAFLVTALTGALTLAGCFGLIAAAGPVAFVRHRARSRRVERQALWPEAIDHLTSGIRAGLSLPEAVAGLSTRGPETLRPLFSVFALEYRATGSFALALDSFKKVCADPVADRIVAALSVSREVGGADLGTLLRTLSQFLRDEWQTRAELKARQSWTINAARLGVAAPWVVLALLATRPETTAAYSTPAGAMLLFVGLLVSIAAYSLMKRIGRLPAEPRVLR